jgi:hypothetical protein
MMSAKQGARHVPDGLARNGIPEGRNHRPSDESTGIATMVTNLGAAVAGHRDE